MENMKDCLDILVIDDEVVQQLKLAGAKE